MCGIADRGHSAEIFKCRIGMTISGKFPSLTFDHHPILLGFNLLAFIQRTDPLKIVPWSEISC